MEKQMVIHVEHLLEAYNRWVAKEITAVEAIRLSEVSKTTFYRLVKKVDNSDNKNQ